MIPFHSISYRIVQQIASFHMCTCHSLVAIGTNWSADQAHLQIFNRGGDWYPSLKLILWLIVKSILKEIYIGFEYKLFKIHYIYWYQVIYVIYIYIYPLIMMVDWSIITAWKANKFKATICDCSKLWESAPCRLNGIRYRLSLDVQAKWLLKSSILG